ncbi:hypothetical protein C8250_031070 [Streptomyces sp. So13.3]|uniref:hypothetical protein n=1 Tax=Streptomyces TaxID=1883 RepID=UPI001105CEBE|nr:MULTISPECIES: hypothetical protein [Streptomyces]MCZ4095513.1 hypothetical protein [Streptomyces sp. H39-C1]QNA75739.1 hypothetical protein C8250_031070 [Streptomyces sp. So13.3]
MGVFGWFRRQSADPSTEAAEAVTLTAEPEGVEAVAEPAEAAEPAGDAEPAGAAEPVGIPKQQSTADAADSEAGEGARA